MADAQHIYMVASGGYTDHAEEHWQFGIRFAYIDSGSTPATSGAVVPFTVDAASVARTESHWTIVSTWSGHTSLTTFNPDDWLNDQVGPSFDAHFGTGIASKVRLDSLKASPINASGHVVGGRTCILDWTASNPTGADSSNMLPLENSVVASWGTPQIGRRGRGRVYLPPASTASVNADGLLDATKQGALLSSVTSMLEGMAFTPGIGGSNVWILPIVTGTPWTEYGQIVKIRIGNVFDTQRRRRRQMVESYVESAPSY